MRSISYTTITRENEIVGRIHRIYALQFEAMVRKSKGRKWLGLGVAEPLHWPRGGGVCLGVPTRYIVTTCILPRILKRTPVTKGLQGVTFQGAGEALDEDVKT